MNETSYVAFDKNRLQGLQEAPDFKDQALENLPTPHGEASNHSGRGPSEQPTPAERPAKYMRSTVCSHLFFHNVSVNTLTIYPYMCSPVGNMIL